MSRRGFAKIKRGLDEAVAIAKGEAEPARVTRAVRGKVLTVEALMDAIVDRMALEDFVATFAPNQPIAWRLVTDDGAVVAEGEMRAADLKPNGFRDGQKSGALTMLLEVPSSP